MPEGQTNHLGSRSRQGELCFVGVDLPFRITEISITDFTEYGDNTDAENEM